jgi:hypothetical protein
MINSRDPYSIPSNFGIELCPRVVTLQNDRWQNCYPVYYVSFKFLWRHLDFYCALWSHFEKYCNVLTFLADIRNLSVAVFVRPRPSSALQTQHEARFIRVNVIRVLMYVFDLQPVRPCGHFNISKSSIKTNPDVPVGIAPETLHKAIAAGSLFPENGLHFSKDRTHVPNLHIIMRRWLLGQLDDGCEVEATFCLNVINPYLG